MTRRSALLPILLLGLLGSGTLGMAACRGKQEPPPAQAARQPEEAPAAPEPARPATAPDAGVGTISSRDSTPEGTPPAAPAPSGPAADNAKLQFDLPKGWTSETPKSSMRLAQATIPGPAGAGDLAVFYFGAGQGGNVEANIERWIDQVEAAPGTPKPERGTLDANGLKVSWVDVHGTLKPNAMGMGPSTPVTNARLFGAVVEGPGGPWFFKVTGPDKTLAPQRDAFFAMLKTVRAAPNA
ncbi:MAG: hypothetical protein QOJ16_1054 [Acidobacteriota bacterium]|nr:hypothetical protein [Acidobacteriota bacterium]